MKLLLYSFITLLIAGCNSVRTITDQSSVNEEPSVTISVLIEKTFTDVTLNDVMSACCNIRPFKAFSVNYISAEKTEVKFIYGDISAIQKEYLYEQLNGMGVKVITSSGF